MNTYTIYADQVEEVRKRLDRLAKKAANYKIPFSYTISEEHPKKVSVYEVDSVTQTIHTVGTYMVAAVDITVNCEGLIRANGWTLRARVEHGSQGNIVMGIGDKPVDPEWYKMPSCCDHCKTKRIRPVTYFCENESGEIRQVGRTCLKDYTGISTATAAMWAEVRDIINDDMSCTTAEWEKTHRSHRMYDTELILAHACDSIQKEGYRKKTEQGSTRNAVQEKIDAGVEPSAEAMGKAKTICDWLSSLDEVARNEDAAISAAWKKFEETGEYSDNRAYWKLERDRTGLERKCIHLALSGYAKSQHIGLLTYMPVAYEHYLERKARREKWRTEKLEAAAASNYVGNEGQRITITTATAKLVASWETDFGVIRLYKFTDAQGNVFVWRTSKNLKISDCMQIKGTVKEHSEYDGVKQTVITRCVIMA